MFKKFYKYDRLLRDKCLNDLEPTFRFLNWNGDLMKAVFPISKFLEHGWKLL